MARIMAIDYGKKRVGLAVTDPLQIIATGLTTVAEKEAMAYIKDYVKKEPVEKLVVGYPTNWDNSPTHATGLVEQFIKKLEKAFPSIPVVQEDERNTSKMAAQSMVQSGVRKKQRQQKENLDQISATIILQSYMQNHP